MAGGNTLLDAMGNEVLDADGNVMLTNASDECPDCCTPALCYWCPAGIGPAHLDVTFAGVNLSTCRLCIEGDRWSEHVSGTIDGTYRIPLTNAGSLSLPCAWEGDIVVNAKQWNGSGCTGTVTHEATSAHILATFNGTKWKVLVNFLVGGNNFEWFRNNDGVTAACDADSVVVPNSRTVYFCDKVTGSFLGKDGTATIVPVF